MLVANFTSRIPTMGNTKTVEDWSKYLGMKPHRLGVVARMYTDNTLNFITDGLRNIFYKDKDVDKFNISTSMMFEWDIETNNIKKVEFAKFLPKLEKMELKLLWHLGRTITRSMTSSVSIRLNSSARQLLDLFVEGMTFGKCRFVLLIMATILFWTLMVVKLET